MIDLHELPKMRDSLSFLYVEHAIVERKDSSVEFINEDGRAQVPAANLSTLMLGPGTRITYAAVAILAECGCSIVWTGAQGNRFYAQGMGETRKFGTALRVAGTSAHQNGERLPCCLGGRRPCDLHEPLRR